MLKLRYKHKGELKVFFNEEFVSNIKHGIFTDKKLSLIDENLTDVEIDGLVDALKSNPYIEELDLSFNNLSNQGASSLAELTDLKWLNVSSNNIGFEGCIALAKSNLITIHISANPIGNAAKEFSLTNSLRELVAAECNITDDIAKSLFLSKSIETLDLSTNKISGSSLEEINHNLILKKLNLAQNPIKKEYCKYFSNNRSLVSLNLTNTFISNIGADLLANNKFLKELILTQCSIGDDGALALSKNTTLKILILLGNNITDSGVAFLAANNTIMQLNLQDNQVSMQSLLKQRYQENIGFIFKRTDEFISKLLKKSSEEELPVAAGNRLPLTVHKNMIDDNVTKRKAERINIDIINNPEFIQFFIQTADEPTKEQLFLIIKGSHEQFQKKQKIKTDSCNQLHK